MGTREAQPSTDSLDPLSHPAPSRQASPTIPTLDGFRAIAIIIVMLSHVGLSRISPGRFGVTLFFFLSGYLITTLLRREWLRTGTVSFRAFYLRRAVRILPPMWLAIGLAAGLSLLGLTKPINPGGLIFDFAFLTNYFPESSVPIGLWSLAVEEHFYVLFPAIALLTARRWGAAGCALLCLAFCFFELGVRIVEVNWLANLEPVNFWTHTRLDSILFGSILALWNNPVIDPVDRLPGRLPSYLIGGGLLLIAFIVRDEAFRQTLRYTIQGFGLILVFNAAIRDDRFAGPLLGIAPLRFIALLSYTLYLVHGIFIELTEPLGTTMGKPVAVMCGILLSFVFAYLVHIGLERPLAQWRRGAERWLRARSGKADPPEAQLLGTKG